VCIIIFLILCLTAGVVQGEDGTLQWEYDTGGTISYSSSAIGSDGTIYFGAHDDYLYAIKTISIPDQFCVLRGPKWEIKNH